MVPDSFGSGSIFQVARVGSLRIVRAADRRRKSVGNRRPPPLIGAGQPLVPLTKLSSLIFTPACWKRLFRVMLSLFGGGLLRIGVEAVRGLLKRLNRSEKGGD
jgi:hypothetical protein